MRNDTNKTKIVVTGEVCIYKRHIPPNPPQRMEHYILYRVDGYGPQFLDAAKAWAKARDLKGG